MWKYETSVDWKEGKKGETHAGGKPSIEIAIPPEFGGPPNCWSPEDLLTSAVASCVMLSVLFLVEKAGIEMRSYTSNATGIMEKTPSGLAITGVKVDITISLADAGQEPEIRTVVERAEKMCPISNALQCSVEVDLHVNSE